MQKGLAILGIVGTLLAALFAFAVSGVVVGVAVFLFLLVAGILVIVARPVLLGVAILVLALLSLLFFTPLNYKGQEYFGNLPDYFRTAWMPTLLVLGCIGILVAARDRIEPAWTGWLGLAAGVLAILLVAFVPTAQQGNFANPLGIGVAVLVLFLLFPLIALLRGPPAPVAPAAPRSTTTTTTTTRTVRK